MHPKPVEEKLKEVLAKLALLTAPGLIWGLAQGWAAARTYQPGYPAGFHTGVLHGILMPAALPGLLLGHPLPIYPLGQTEGQGGRAEYGCLARPPVV